ncbi:MAG: hypothetical protein ACI97A_002833, partial [Planctomycetota bacterium]
SGDQAKTFGGSRAKVERFQSTSFSFVGWNCKRGIASSAVARQVLGRLIPREKIASRSSSLQPHTGLFQTMNPQSYTNVVTAAELKGIGLSDVTGNGKLEWQSKDFQLRVLLPTGKIPWAEETISAWRDVAAQRGLVLAVERLPVPILIDRLQAGDFDAFAIIWRVRHQEPSFFDLLHSSQAGAHGRNFMGVQDSRLDSLLASLEACNDPLQRQKVRSELAQVTSDLEPLTPLFRHEAFVGIRDDHLRCVIGVHGLDWPSLSKAAPRSK